MQTRYWRIAASAILFIVAVGVMDGQDKPAAGSVSAVELNSGTQIIGLLGLPLGELASIKGKILETNTKGDDKSVEVVEVNGKALREPVQMRFSIWEWGNLGQTTLPLNQILGLRVYETGGMVGVPIKAMRETTFVQTEGWGFSTSLVLLNRE
jgi:hypothetical protein